MCGPVGPRFWFTFSQFSSLMPRTGLRRLKKRRAVSKADNSGKRARLNPPVYVRSNRTELKNVYDVIPSVNISQNGTIYSFGGVAQGTGMHERIGKSRYSSKFRVASFVLPSRLASIVQHPNHHRCVETTIRRYPTVTDILEVIGGVTMMQAPYKTESSKTYVILGDELLNLPAQASVGSSGATDPISETYFLTRKYKYRGVKSMLTLVRTLSSTGSISLFTSRNKRHRAALGALSTTISTRIIKK